MKSAKQFLFTGLAMAFILSSCSVEKRRYSSGYHINWLKKKHTEESKPVKDNPVYEAEETVVAEAGTRLTENTVPSAAAFAPAAGKAVSKPVVKERAVKPAAKKSIIKYMPVMKQAAKHDDKPSPGKSAGEPRLDGLALAGFIIGIVGWFMPLALGLIMCIIAIIFGAISLNRINKHPDQYRGRGFAITSLVVGIVGVALVFLIAAAGAV